MATTVLVLEDDENLQESLREDLEALCLTVHTSADAERAIELAGRNHYDLMVTDIRIAGKRDGIEALEAIRRTSGHQELPCIVITGFSENEVVLRALKVNIQAYLAKPFDLRTLYNTVNACLNAQKGRPELLRAVHGLLRWFKLDPKSQEERREQEKAPLRQEIEKARSYLYSIFCSGLQMNTQGSQRTRERFLLISAATDIWHQLRPLERDYFGFSKLPRDEARLLVTRYSEVLAHLKNFTERSAMGSGIYPANQNLPKEVFIRFVRRIESRQITPEETSYGWWLWEIQPEIRNGSPKLQELYQLLWGEQPPEQRRWKESSELILEAEQAGALGPG